MWSKNIASQDSIVVV